MAYKILETVIVTADELNVENPDLMCYVCDRLHKGSNHIRFIKIHDATNAYIIEYHSVRTVNSYMPAGVFSIDENKINLVSHYF